MKVLVDADIEEYPLKPGKAIKIYS